MIDFGDTLDVDVLSGEAPDKLTCTLEDVPTDASNLVVKVHIS